VAAVLAAVAPLADLILQAKDPVHLAETILADVQAGIADGQALVERIAVDVRDRGLTLPCLVLAGIVNPDTRAVRSGAVVPAAQLLAVVEIQMNADRWQLALTVPPFVRPAFNDMVADLPPVIRPVETLPAIQAVAQSAQRHLILAAPYLHPTFMAIFVPHVNRIAAADGTVLLLTRALSALSEEQSRANVDALRKLREGVSNREALMVRSWEEAGLGLHLKAVVADEHMAYIGSANLTLTGTSAQAEAGVLLSGPGVKVLARWLEAINCALGDRRLPHSRLL
jgi:phosphatidylserine/phosphatidylglycerophosphate/cardiolipin synthase-like enzyme